MLKEGFQSSISLLPFSPSQILHFSWILAFSFAKRATPFLKAMASAWCFLVFSFKSFRQNNHIPIQALAVHSLGWTEVKTKLYSTRAHKNNLRDVLLHVSLSEGDWATLRLQPQLMRASVQRTLPKAGLLCTGIWAPLRFWTSRVNKYISFWQSHCFTQLAFSYY